MSKKCRGFKLKEIEENNLMVYKRGWRGYSPSHIALCVPATPRGESQVQYLDLLLEQGYIIRSFKNVLGNCLVLQIGSIITKQLNTKDWKDTISEQYPQHTNKSTMVLILQHKDGYNHKMTLYQRLKRRSIHYKFLGICPPTPPLSQHFALSEK